MLITRAIIYIIRKVRPIHTLTINVDGPVPEPKIAQQRTRRYAGFLDHQPGDLFNSAAITPGTTWSIGLDQYLLKAMPQIQDMMHREGLGTHIVYSSHLVPGEGEHKIFQRMKSNVQTYDKMQGLRVVLGGDTDLILLGMMSGIQNLQVLTDIYIKIERENRGPLYLRANDFVEPSLINIEKLNHGVKMELNRRESAIHDFAFIISLVGNDFIPRMPSMNALEEGVDSMINAMRLMNIEIISSKTYTINWHNVLKLLKVLVTGSNEHKVRSDIDRISLYNKSIGKNRGPWRPFEAALKNSKDTLNALEVRENFKSAWYYNALAPKFPELLDGVLDLYAFTPDDIMDMCVQYLFGMNWVNKYYLYGTDYITWAWHYPYHYSPMLSDLAVVLEAILEIPDGLELINPSAKPGEVRINPLHQMVAVIPPSALSYVPPQIQELWKESSPLSSYSIVGFVVDQDGYIPNPMNEYYKDKVEKSDRPPSWEGTIIISTPSHQDLIDAIDSLNLIEETKLFFAFKSERIWGSAFDTPTLGMSGGRESVHRLNTRVLRAPQDQNIGRAGASRGRGSGGGSNSSNGGRARKLYTHTRSAGPLDTEESRKKDFFRRVSDL
jgi:5'-3' exoribonuclease 2